MLIRLQRLRHWVTADERATSERGWSVNLDIFRVVFLGAVILPWSIHNLTWVYDILPTLPREVWSPISFYQLVPYAMLSSSTVAKAIALTNLALIVSGLIGFYTRTSIGLACVLSLYIFGLSENQGKVDNLHHMIWFLALLAVGPSGRFLSIDSARRAIRRADDGLLQAADEFVGALWTLRYIWLLLGLLYLTPGLAKLLKAFTGGWASASNLRHVLWLKWFEVSLFVPRARLPPRIDLLPSLLLEIAGLTVIAFESGFLLLVLFRRLRPWLAIAGLGFHAGNGLFLRIWFETLMPVYVCLFDWASLGRALSRRQGPLLVLYDGGCQTCRRTVAVLKSLDLFDVVAHTPLSNSREILEQFPGVTYEAVVSDLHARSKGRTAVGYDAYVLIARRLILLWPLSLLMRLPPVASAGRRVYRRVADSRHCALVPAHSPRRSAAESHARLLHPVGIALIVCQLVISSIMFLAKETPGFTNRLPAPLSQAVWRIVGWQLEWPFNSYPSFAYPTPDVFEIWEARWVLPAGEVRVSPDTYAAAFGSSALLWSIVNTAGQETDPDRFQNLSIGLTRSLWQKETNDTRAAATGANVYRVRYRLGPYAPPARVMSETLVHAFSRETLAQ